jgi:4-amino-4-deoxy-L-arabinose transferase-like glycosyltransferase
MSSRPSAAAVPAPLLVGAGTRRRALRAPRPELVGLLVLAGVLYLWALSRNGWANDYYSAAVRSMSTSWHNFLFASLDPSGVMTVDKPPLSLWVQALSVRAFGYHPLAILVPQALMGIAAVWLTYDLVRRRFGRLAGFTGGLALALTPIAVAIFRYNQPDALLVLCTIAALWFTIRGLEDGRTRWLVAAGVCVGLGFETKMLVALVVVPGIAAAWLWTAPGARALQAGGRLRAARQLLAGGAAMTLVGGAWPLLVELTPAADRPWISGTSDNRVLSLIFEYNGVGRVDGQTGGPGGIAGNQFGGSAGPVRLLNAALGGQGGWLLGFALVSAFALLVATRLRRSDARTGWLIAVGGGFLTTAALFSFASGIFHPYYVSLLAPFTAALVGAGAGHLISGRDGARVFGPLAIAAGVACELVVLGDYAGQLRWFVPVLIVFGGLAAVALAAGPSRRGRISAVAVATGTLMIAPAVWAFDTLGHSVTGTFPEGGPSSVLAAGGPGRLGARAGFGGFGGPPGAARAGAVPPAGLAAGSGMSRPAPPGFAGAGAFGGGTGPGGRTVPGGAPGGAGGPGAFGRSVSSKVLAYVKAHGGGTIAVSSQSSAAGAIIAKDAAVAGIGGFSGRESSVSVSWLAEQVREGKIRWVLDEERAGTTATGGAGAGALGSAFGSGGGTLPFGAGRGDTRAGSRKAIAAAASSCTRVSLGGGEATSGTLGTASGTLYDCQGHAAALEHAAS